MTLLYSTAILFGSCLLFLVQPMCAKMLLPLLGGTPAVWNTCMVFFQAGLLCGYAYAHALPRLMGTGRHAILHLLLLILAYFLLPIQLPNEVPDGWHPILWLLASLTLSVGLPFVLLAAGAPLLQRWFVYRTQEAPRDPYFLYAASNLGSFLALGLFPFVLEPYFSLPFQSEIWKFAFLGLVAILAFCVPLRGSASVQPAKSAGDAPDWWKRSRWTMLALIPSSLLLSVTTHLTTDVAAIPLLWLIPMGLYLLTFTLVFSDRQWISHAVFQRWLPLVVIVVSIVMLSEGKSPIPMVLGLHLLAFFWLAMACHGELARTRPPAANLTDFYLCLALGGVLGGALNALIAPLIFNGLYEYPLMIVLASAFGMASATRPTRDDWLWAAGIGGLSVLLVLLFQTRWLFPLDPGPISVGAMFGLPMVLGYVAKEQPARFALCIGAVLLASGLYHGVYGVSAYRERSYFGIHRVTELNGLRSLVHGNTIHGQQNPNEPHRPLTYFSTAGPIGDVFKSYKDDPRLQRVGVVGLGTGSLAAYSRPGQDWTFFEIDPTVQRIAENPKLFTYLKDAEGKIGIELGDARLQLEKSTQTFGLLVVDAFGSDSIPLHLLTREAMAIYLKRLEPNGILVFHISNDFVDLEPVLANLAADTKPRSVASIRQHRGLQKAETEQGIMASDWLALARSAEDLQPLLDAGGWRPARANSRWNAWTDASSNLFQVFRFQP